MKNENRYAMTVAADEYAVCRLPPESATPGWATGGFVTISRTPDELSIVCERDNVPDSIPAEGPWRALRVAGPLPFSMIGVIAELTGVLAAANISVFVVSTFDTDYLLVKSQNLALAIRALRAAGHACGDPPDRKGVRIE